MDDSCRRPSGWCRTWRRYRFVIPCYEPYIPRIEGDDSFFATTLYGSIFLAVWNFQLALYSRGYGTCITTLHLAHEETVRGLLGIPATYV